MTERHGRVSQAERMPTVRKVTIWLLLILVWLLGFATAKCFADEVYDNADIYKMVYESGTKPFFSTNVPKKLPPPKDRGLIQCDKGMDVETTPSGMQIGTCIEVPKSWRKDG